MGEGMGWIDRGVQVFDLMVDERRNNGVVFQLSQAMNVTLPATFVKYPYSLIYSQIPGSLGYIK